MSKWVLTSEMIIAFLTHKTNEKSKSLAQGQIISGTERHAMLGWAAGYFLAVNLSAYGAFYIDKTRAQNRGRRISESNLLTLALIGGSIGAITAQQKFRHKTKKQPFKAQLYGIAALQIVGIMIWSVPPFRAELLALVQ